MNSTFRNITLHVLFYHWWIYSGHYHNRGWTGGTLIHSPAPLLLSPTPFLISPTSLHLSPFPFFSPLFSILPPLVSFFPVSLYTVGPLITDAQTGQKKQYTSTFRNFVPNLPVSAILVLPVFSRIFQYLQYWYNQYFLESSSICNTGITRIF